MKVELAAINVRLDNGELVEVQVRTNDSAQVAYVAFVVEDTPGVDSADESTYELTDEREHP